MNTYPTIIFGIKGNFPKRSAGYIRVSTKSQLNDNTSVMWQSEKLNEFISDNKFNSIEGQYLITEVNRGDNNICLETFLNAYTNMTLFVYDANRFCNSTLRGNMYLDIALANHITIIFVRDKIVWNPMPFCDNTSFERTRIYLLELFGHAERERMQVAMHVSQTNQFCKDNFVICASFM